MPCEWIIAPSGKVDNRVLTHVCACTDKCMYTLCVYAPLYTYVIYFVYVLLSLFVAVSLSIPIYTRREDRGVEK